MILVSIHDVAPPNLPAVQSLWDRCLAAGVTPALLVVPDWHGNAPIEHDPAFLDWVRQAMGQGAEIILHGERHDEVGRTRTVSGSLRAWGRTAREGECLELSRDDLRQLVARGLARLRAAGLEPGGFIPPAWLVRTDAVAGAFDAGCVFVEDEHTVHLAGGRRLPSPAVRFSARTPFRARASVVVANARWLLQRSRSPVRLALHPGDLGDERLAKAVDDHIARWTALGPVGRYRDLVA